MSQDDGDVDSSFRPTERTCVCICSDWRSYQKLTAEMSSAAVVHALETDYIATDALLDRCFPRGNYFSDWIADELFVVAFALGAGEEQRLAQEAVTFARELIEERRASRPSRRYLRPSTSASQSVRQRSA